MDESKLVVPSHPNASVKLTKKVIQAVKGCSGNGCSSAEVLLALGLDPVKPNEPTAKAILSTLGVNSSKKEGVKILKRSANLTATGQDVVVYAYSTRQVYVSPCYVCGNDRRNSEWKLCGGSFGPSKHIQLLKGVIPQIMCELCYRSNVLGQLDPIETTVAVLPACLDSSNGSLFKPDINDSITQKKNTISSILNKSLSVKIMNISEEVKNETDKHEVTLSPSKSSHKFIEAGSPGAVQAEEIFPVERSGWLFKKGGTIFQTWSKRWFILTPTTLSYYSSDVSSKARKAIDLKGFNIKHSVRDSDDRYPFTVILDDGRSGWGSKSYLIAASNQEEESSWIGSIQACIDHCS